MRATILTFALFLSYSSSIAQVSTLIDSLSDQITYQPTEKEAADTILSLIIKSKAFDWTDIKNNCEDRANAVCIALDSFNVSNGKIWIVPGKNVPPDSVVGTLKGWTYHVAACFFIKNKGKVDTIVLDPLTGNKLLSIDEWTYRVTCIPGNFHFITGNNKYQRENFKSLSTSPDSWIYLDSNKVLYYEKTLKGLTRYNDFNFWTKVKTHKFIRKRLVMITKEFESLCSYSKKNL